MKYARLFADEQGESRFEDLEAQFRPVDFAPPAPPLDISEFGSVENCFILKGPSGWLAIGTLRNFASYISTSQAKLKRKHRMVRSAESEQEISH